MANNREVAEEREPISDKPIVSDQVQNELRDSSSDSNFHVNQMRSSLGNAPTTLGELSITGDTKNSDTGYKPSLNLPHQDTDDLKHIGSMDLSDKSSSEPAKKNTGNIEDLKEIGSLDLPKKNHGDLLKENPANTSDLDNLTKSSWNPGDPTRGWDGVTPPSQEDLKKRIGDASVVFFAEDHQDRDPKDPKRVEQFRNALEALKEANKPNKTAVALEGWNEEAINNVLKPYLRGDKGSERVLDEYLAKNFNSEGPDWTNKMKSMLEAIKTTGDIDVIGLDKTNPFASTGGDQTKNRNQHWADAISKYLQSNPDAKVMVLGGEHWNRPKELTREQTGDTVAEILDKMKIKMVDLTTPTDTKRLKEDRAKNPELEFPS